MQSLTRLLFITIVLAIVAAAVAGQDKNADADSGSISIGFTFDNLGTKKETERVVDGIKLIYPEDEADVIELILPRIKAGLAMRKKQALEEAEAIDQVYREIDMRNMMKKHVAKMLELKTVSLGIDHAYDEGVLEIEAFSRQWQQWSSDLSEFHLYNHATVEPFRTGSERIEFDELHIQLDDNDDDNTNDTFELTLSPSIINPGIGMGMIDPEKTSVVPFSFCLPILLPPGTPAEHSAATLNKIIDLAFQLFENFARGQFVEISDSIVQERLLLHEIETNFFQSDPPRSITRGLARTYLLLSKILQNKDEPLQIMRYVLPDVSGDPQKVRERLTALESRNPLTDDSTDYETDQSRIIALSLMKVVMADDDGSPTLKILRKKGIATPDGGFDRQSFVDAMIKADPDFENRVIENRDELIKRTRAYLDQAHPQPGEDDNKPEGRTDSVTKKGHPIIAQRITKKIDGTTFSYPPSLEKAVLEIAPEWAVGMRKLRATIDERFGSNKQFSPPVVVEDETLKAIRKLGIPAERDAATYFSNQAAMAANAPLLFFGLFDGNDIAVWARDDLEQVLKNGVEVDSFKITPEGKLNYTFGFKFNYTADADSKMTDIVDSMGKIPAPTFYAIAKSEDDRDLADLPVEKQIAAIREGAQMIQVFFSAADKITPEQVGGLGSRILDERQSFLVIIHEVVETGLIREVISSKNRRWFCDGMANLIALRHSDRRFGEGSGLETLNTMYDVENIESLAAQVDLLDWQAAENDANNPSIAEAKGLTAAYYYYATKALLAATEGRGEDFPAKWIAEIKKTNWNRTNARTAIDAYQKLTGEDLEKIVREVTESKH